MISDERGADSLPMGIVTCTIVAAIILGIVAYGLSYALPVVDSALADGQVSKADGELQGLLLCSPRNLLDPGSSQGTIRTISFSLPADTEYVAFGFDPEGNVSSEGTIYYKIHGTKKAVVVDTEVKFRVGEVISGRMMPSDRHLRISGGKKDIQFEYAYSPATGQKYLLSL
jgi:hypothetical protein